MQLYEYHPLESTRHIRLLSILPCPNHDGADGETTSFVAELDHVGLDDPDRPKYEPVSYVWTGPEIIAVGDPAAERASTRDEVLPTTDGRVLMITASLHGA